MNHLQKRGCTNDIIIKLEGGVHNMGEIEHYKCSQVCIELTWCQDGHGGKLPWDNFCLTCYSFEKWVKQLVLVLQVET